MGEADESRIVDDNERNKFVELPMIDEKVWLGMFFSWFITWACVLYHYRFEVPKYQGRAWDWKDIFVCVLFFGTSGYVFSKRKVPISLSLSDASKLLCMMIIMGCILYHI